MKKYLLICLCSILAKTSLAQELAIIPDTNFRNAVLIYCDTNKDGLIQLDETDNLTYFIGHEIIKNLEGIGQFKNLEGININCDTELADFSKNIKIRKIIMPSAGLKKIILGQLDYLQILMLQSNNLTTIDISGCPNLKDLDLGWNKFKSIDVITNINLQTLTCMNNQLTSLDIRSCVNMRQGFAKYTLGQPPSGLSCEENPDLKVICIPETLTKNYWFKDEQAIFSTTCEPAAVESSEGTTELVLYPNPASSIVNLPLANTSQHSMITIANSLGQEVLQLALAPQQTEIPIEALPTGIYTLTLRTTTGNLLGQSKLVKY